jgi:hypothetical protein
VVNHPDSARRLSVLIGELMNGREQQAAAESA